MTNPNEVQNVPSDAEIIAWASEEQFFLFCDQDELLDIVRATIAKYGAPLAPLTLSLSPDPRGVHVAVHQGSEFVQSEAMALPATVGQKYVSGIEAAAAWVDQRRAAFDDENGHADPDTGAFEYGSGAHAEVKLEYSSELGEIAEGIRSLAGACLVPPPGWECSRKAGHDGPCATSPTPPAGEGQEPVHPNYPKGIVDGPCVCGGWPGGECLRCPKIYPKPAPQAAQGDHDRIAAALHYPDHWDTAAYPTLESALIEVTQGYACNECAKPTQDEREAFIKWLSGTYPNAFTEREASRYWSLEHISALAWEARAALSTPPMAVDELAARVMKLLAAEHRGMRVDYSGMLYQASNALIYGGKEPGLAEMLRQLQGHMTELGLRWYGGDTAVVDELLQLYCIGKESRTAIASMGKGPTCEN